MVLAVSEATSAPLTITLFGPMQVLVHGEPLPPLRSRKALWLLALLVLRHGRPVEREWLASTLWPDVDPERSLASLRSNLSELRTALGPEGQRLQSPNRRTLLLELSGADVDVIAFDDAIASKSPAAPARAVARYAGSLLEGCPEEWVPQERDAREQDCLRALQMLADAALAAGTYPAAIGYYQRAIVLDPWRDAARRGLMEALSRSGDTNAALQVYRDFVSLLRSDPKAVPDAQTSALYTRLRAEVRERSATQTAPETAVLGTPTPAVTGYLPHALTDLVGREDERLEVMSRLRRSRLVTLTGPGGIGKTRLALEVATEAVQDQSPYPDGVWLVALDALADNAQVAGQVVSVLGLKEEAGRTVLQSLTDHLRGRRVLLVLDNCEHLLEGSAQVAGHLLRECAGVRILATSREALGITGETAWQVPALAVPDPAHLPTGRTTLVRVLSGYESVQLFVERAQSVQKSFALTGDNAQIVAEVCARLGGLPLAIELAAARIKVMTVAQIAARLDDHLGLLTGGSRVAPSRQQTLRGTMDWSYALLSVPEQILLGQLSVFAGGWVLEAAEAVGAGPGIAPGQILDLLVSLADKSLVVFEEREQEGRYRLLETLRQYAAERLAASGKADVVRARHRDWFLALAEEGETKLKGPEQGVWLQRLEAERDNLRTALAWCGAEKNGAEAGLQLAGALWRFWELHGYFSEGRASLAEALAREGTGVRANSRAKALNAEGVLAFYQGDYASARILYEESLTIFRDVGNKQGIALSLKDLGKLAGMHSDAATAMALYQESLGISRELADRQACAEALNDLGNLAIDQGDYASAMALYEESLGISRELANTEGIAWSLMHLASLRRDQGDFEAASDLFDECLAIFRDLGNKQAIAWSLSGLGKLAFRPGNHAAAQALYEESLTIFRDLGNKQGTALSLNYLGILKSEQEDYEAARTFYAESLTIFRELGNRLGTSWSLSGLGYIALALGDAHAARALYAESIRIQRDVEDRKGLTAGLRGLATSFVPEAPEKAVHLWGASEALRASVDAPIPSHEQEKHAHQVAQTRAALGDAAFSAAWNTGCALTWEQAVAYALGEIERE